MIIPFRKRPSRQRLWRGATRLVALLSLVMADAWLACGQTNFYTINTNGPASNRLNLVFLSEGYTNGQYIQYLTHVTNTANSLFSNQPFAQYRSYFNVYAIAVASAQPGSDLPVPGIYRNTYFNSSFGNNTNVPERLLTIPPNWANANYGLGQGKVDNLLQTFMPSTDLAIMLVNDLNLGGSDGAGKTAIASIAPNSLSDTPVHEAGHVLANLGDESTNPNPGYPNIEEPNTTRETNRAAIKWNAWIANDTPIPTPPTFEYLDAVGLFEGAHYHTTGWYRPKLNCRMGSFGVPFCEVCREALVLSFYRKVRPVEAFAPVITNFSASSPQVLDFTVTTMQPMGHELTVQWLTNGITIGGATNSAFSILPSSLGDGTHAISVVVTDPTPFVRTDASNLLSQSLTWNVSVSLPYLELSNPRWLGPGTFAFRVSGVSPQGFTIQASTNLANWTTLSTNYLVNGAFDYTHQNAVNVGIRLFRAATPP